MTDGHCFISYSNADGLKIASQLANDLQGRHPFIKVWFDKEKLDAGEPWDSQIAEAIQGCKCLLFLMTEDSVTENSVCKDEWTWALKYKKPIIPLHFHPKADLPFRLNNLQFIDFVRDHNSGLAQLRERIEELDSPKGILDQLKHRLADANRDLRRAKDEDKPRIQVDIDELNKQIEAQQKIVDDPKGAQEQTQKNIDAGLERERRPEKESKAKEISTKFINPPPGIAPTYFQDRTTETGEIIRFLQDDSQRLLTIVGRGGVGKTAMVCRLLKHLESGTLPEDLQETFKEMKVDGIVYLSESGSHHVNFANLFYDLCKLLPADAANALDAVYKNPQASTASKMSALLDRFTAGKVVLLLDNVEPLISVETFDIADAELDECLRALLHGAHSALKIILTTRVAPRGLNLCEPGRQRVLTLDSGLEQKYAVEMLREIDVDGKLGLKSADPEALKRAYERTLGFPRALEALFAILASDRYTTLDELLAMPTPVNVVEALVGEAFNRLDTNAQKVMQALAVYNRPVTPAAVDYLLAPHLPAMDSAPILRRLFNMHFVRRFEGGKFYLHPVDREFAFELIAKGEKGDFTQRNLLLCAADYFLQARKPPEDTKNLKDLNAQLAEFDLRCQVRDYDTAANIFIDINDYLDLWGHYALLINGYELILENIIDKDLRMSIILMLGWESLCIGQYLKSADYFEKGLQVAKETKNRNAEARMLGNLGSAYTELGNGHKAIEVYEQALVVAREVGNRKSERADLSNLGIEYAALGDIQKAIGFSEQGLVIAREIGDRRGEGHDLHNIGCRYIKLGNYEKALDNLTQAISIYSELGDSSGNAANFERIGYIYLSLSEYQKAKEYFIRSIEIADEISRIDIQQSGRWAFAQSYLFQNDLVNARATVEAALGYDVPRNNHDASALHGIIALRQGDEVAARGAFLRAIGQADEILSNTAEYYSALDAKGLALCGLAILGDSHLGGDCHLLAIETFQKARKIAPHAGVVKSVLRLFDELAKCDTEGILKDVRSAAEGRK